MRSLSRNGGFAIGLILLVIVLMAAISTAMSIGSRGNFGLIDNDKARGYASHLRSQANAIKSVIQNIRARGVAMQNIDRRWDCTGSSCLEASMQNSRFLNEVFATTPSAVTHSYKQWANDKNAVFKDGLELDVYVLRQPVRGDVCAAIQSASVGQAVTLQNVPVFSALTFDNGGADATLAADIIPTAQDGCVRATNAAVVGYYYFVIGRACGGSTATPGYWPCS